MRHLLLTASVLSVLADPSWAGEQEPLRARGEVNWRPGQERSILMQEFWVPFAQNSDSVFYGDLRLMGDDTDNREGNAGLGYRRVTTDVPLLGEGVVGVHGWLDRRITESGSHFNQMTLGAEWLGERFDILANGYLPFNDEETYTQANPAGANGHFVGTQLVFNTDQLVKEEALSGFDIELGLELGSLSPALANHTDAVRLYGGGYHFEGDLAEDVSGWRMRLAADITPDIQLGARFQSDDVRGSQGFLDATIRFPFGHKQSFRKQGLYGRLDDSPERDIDIVSNDSVIDDGLNKTLLNAATGQAQEIIHVDNSGANGDGSASTPFNNLTDAQTAAGNNALIYVHRGDGTTTGMADGFDLVDTGQMLIGAGSDLNFERTYFKTSNGLSTTGPILAADPAGGPTITKGSNNIIQITADNTWLSGFTVEGPFTRGVYINNATNVTVEQLTVNNTGSRGIQALLSDSTNYTLTIRNNVVTNIAGRGIWVAGVGASGSVDATIENNTLDSNNESIVVETQRDNVGRFTIQSNIITQGTGNSGIYLAAFSDSGGATPNTSTLYATVYDNIIADQTTQGIRIRAGSTSGSIHAEIYDNEITGNGTNGIEFVNSTVGATMNASVYRNVITDNTNNGVYMINHAGGAFNVDLGDGTLGSIGHNSIYENTAEELSANLDGATLKAEHNWWGTSSGLASDEIAAGSDPVDATPYLTSAP